jgi:hypothetical protein
MITKENFKESDGYQRFQQIIVDSAEVYSDYKPVLNYLENESDFFWAPASSRFHSCFPGGLCVHSLNVYDYLVDINEKNNLRLEKESMAICGLLHDLGKVNFYVLDEDKPSDAQINYLNSLFGSKDIRQFEEQGLTKGWVSDLIDWAKKGKNGQAPIRRLTYKIVDDIPLGHAVRGLSIVQDYLVLQVPEKLSIRWHQGVYESVMGEDRVSFNEARRKYPIVAALMLADYTAAFIKEGFMVPDKEEDIQF